MKRFWAVVAVLVLCSCSASAPPSAEKLFVVYPQPPATTRIQFLTAITDEHDVEEPRSPSFWQRLAGDSEAEEREQRIMKPYGIGMHGGVIYVCDTALPGIVVIDLGAREFERWVPGGLGQLQKPINCHADREDGHLYVADPDRGQVVVFSPDREYVTALGSGAGERPVDVVAAAGHVWVADFEKAEVRAYAKPGYELVATLPGADADSASRIYGVTNIWVEGDELYVSNFGEWKVKVYDLDGNMLRTVGSYGTSVGQFARPKGIAVDRDGILYVVDSAFENVQMFDREGRTLMFFGGSYNGPGDMWLPAQVIIDYDNLDYFRQYVDDSFDLQYLILVTNQFGPDKINVYGFVGPVEEIHAVE